MQIGSNVYVTTIGPARVTGFRGNLYKVVDRKGQSYVVSANLIRY